MAILVFIFSFVSCEELDPGEDRFENRILVSSYVDNNDIIYLDDDGNFSIRYMVYLYKCHLFYDSGNLVREEREDYLRLDDLNRAEFYQNFHFTIDRSPGNTVAEIVGENIPIGGARPGSFVTCVVEITGSTAGNYSTIFEYCGKQQKFDFEVVDSRIKKLEFDPGSIWLNEYLICEDSINYGYCKETNSFNLPINEYNNAYPVTFSKFDYYPSDVDSIIFESSNDDIVSVEYCYYSNAESLTCNLYCHSVGNARITARNSTGLLTSFDVVVKSYPKDINIYIPERSYTIEDFGYTIEGFEQGLKLQVDIEPKDAVITSIDFKYCDDAKFNNRYKDTSNIISINDDGDLVILKPGITDINVVVEYPDFGNGFIRYEFNKSLRLKVSEVPVRSLDIGEGDIDLTVGDKFLLDTQMLPYNNTDGFVRYESNSEIVSINEKGEITAKRAGEAMVKATLGGSYSSSIDYKKRKIIVKNISETDALIFVSDKEFSVASNKGKTWNGTLEYLQDVEVGWRQWNGETLQSVQQDEKYKLFIRGKDNSVITGEGNRWIIKPEGNGNNEPIEIYGDISVLLDYKDVSLKAEMSEYCFSGLFESNSYVKSFIRLPLLNLAPFCYKRMFAETSITEVPELPAEQLSDYCYFEMFKDCRKLTTPSQFSATKLAEGCCKRMFYSSGLTISPQLLATELAKDCYYQMFTYCKSLIVPPKLPATKLAEGCYYSMFSGCTSLTSVPYLPAYNLEKSCYAYMFNNCSLLKFSKTLEGDYANRIYIGGNSRDYILGLFENTGGDYIGDAKDLLGDEVFVVPCSRNYYTSNQVIQ